MKGILLRNSILFALPDIIHKYTACRAGKTPETDSGKTAARNTKTAKKSEISTETSPASGRFFATRAEHPPHVFTSHPYPPQ
ncbi:MAG: hypothetical protein EA357_01740 [Micavibrio sp.]|nr:MAG: hypothetical protein EA357_01740 [Micavibrio sp.]